MTFKINGTPLLTGPSDHRWSERTMLGIDGNSHAIYVTPRQYEFSFDWLDAASFAQLIGFYQACSGTSSVDLPQWGSATGGYAIYNGVIQEPTYSNSFEGFFGSVKLLVINIR
jgi:hypothetical protein